MASRLKDAFAKASPFSRPRPKATVAETAATPANISSDAAFAAAARSQAGTSSSSSSNGTDGAGDDLPQHQTPPTTSSTPRTSSTASSSTSAVTAPEPSSSATASTTAAAANDPSTTAAAAAATTTNPDLHTRYKLHITAGPSYDPATHTTIHVNTPHTVLISNRHLTARVAVRIRDFSGLPSSCPPSTPYFAAPQHARDRYSISFSFVPKRDLPAASAVWGPDCARPVRDRLPPGFNYAVAIVKRFVDPSIEVDAYADEPWVYAPAVSCWFALRVGAMLGSGGGGGGEGEEVVDVPPPQRTEEVDEGEVRAEGRGVLEEGADGDGVEARRRWGCPDEPAKRRKWFVDAKRREDVVFEKGRLYQGDFFNPYLDFDKFALKLPGFSLGVLKYIDEKTHQLRWVFKDRVTGEVYFCVIFNLLFGEELKEALRAEGAAEQELD